MTKVESKQIEKVLAVFHDYIMKLDCMDIARTWKNGYMVLLDSGNTDYIRTGEDMCKYFLDELRYDFYKEHKLHHEEIPIPSHFWNEYLSYVKPYMDQLTEYNHLLNIYRN